MHAAIRTPDDFYRFVYRLMSECENSGETALLGQLDDALHLGSSGTEILGAIRLILTANRKLIERLLGHGGKKEAREALAFVNKVWSP